MLEKPTMRSLWMPLGLAALALVVLNLGLYTQLASQAIVPRFEFPYYENFSSISANDYEVYGGDWEIRDEALVQLSTSGYDLITFIPLEVTHPYYFETTLRFLGGTMGGGLVFNAQQTASRQQSHMVRFNVDGGQLWIIYGYFGDDSNFVGQGSAPLNITPDDATPHKIGVQINADTYTLFVDNARVADNIPIVYQDGAVGFVSATSQVAFDDVRVDDDLPADQPIFVAQPPVIVEQPPIQAIIDGNGTSLFNGIDGVEGGEPLWQPISGNWSFENNTYVQSEPNGFDLSSIYQQSLSYPFNLSTTFQHQFGAGGGVLFNLPTPTRKNGGHMVRYFDDGSVIGWGYFDDAGVFVGQGSVAVNLPDDTFHTLTVSIINDAYAITLDGTELVANIPVVNPVSPGYVGITTSQSQTVFNDVMIFTDEATTTPSTATNINTETANGTWLVDGGIIQQIATENTDYVAGTGLAGEKFTISVDITLPADNPEAGAGIIFHMDGRDDRRLGYMVRFGSGGRELFWGQFDMEGGFNGAGGIPMELTAGESHQLLLIVRENQFDIRVDGQAVVETVPIERGGGWIGLVSFSGAVTFENINLELGEN